MTCPCKRVRHAASPRHGRIVSTQRRFGTHGHWIVWDDAPRPTWHPAKVLQPDTRVELLPDGPIRFWPRKAAHPNGARDGGAR